MSSMIDPAKLKVVDLRSELSARGLDSKGIKAVLVKRLKEALEAELAEEIPDTSIADTSTEDLDNSQPEEAAPADEPPPKVEVQPIEDASVEPMEEEPEPTPTEEPVPEEKSPAEENGDHTEQQEDVKCRKSRWGDEEAVEEPKTDAEPATENVEEEQLEEGKNDGDAEQRGEKRRRSSPSPERSQRRRSKSPIKEDEPPIDNDKVQLSWYDSDLHLQLDKESFLSAKPLHEGAFGYAWAGVRATHGVSTGKVCYEVKLTEELAFEDLSKVYERSRHDSHRSDHRRTTSEKTDKTEESETKSEENGKEEKSEEAKDTTDEQEEKPKDETVAGEKPEEEPTKPEDEKAAEENETETKEDEKMETEEAAAPSEPIPSHLFRVGWSVISTDLQLGEAEHSFGFESSGKFVNNKNFEDYAVKFGVGDVVGAFLSIDDENITVSYTVNGEVQPNAATLPRSDFPSENFALFPHVLSRNYAFELNLGNNDEPWYPIPLDLEDYCFIEKADEKVSGPCRPETRSECEVILMCGLPAAGKTHWVREHIKSNLDKKFTVIGDAHLLDKMTVSGNTLKSCFKGKWSVFLYKMQKSLYKLADLAAVRRRNYIIDQTNVFPSAQRRKLRPFEGFKRRAVVIVVGDEEHARRQALQEASDGKDVPDSAVLEMKANMSLPTKSDWLDEVVYAELEETEAKELVQKYNTVGREAVYGPGGQRRFARRDDRWQNRRPDYRGGKNYRERFPNNRFERGGPRHGNWHHSGGWNRDRRDNRGPLVGGARDWRNNRGASGGRPHDRNRDVRNPVNNYRNNSRGGGRGQGSWQGSGGSWNQGQGQGWNAQGYGQWGSGQQNWSQASQNQWKYGGPPQTGYGNYGNWNNYYGQYAQNWSNPSQGQAQSGAAATGTTASSYQGQGYSQQAAWAQYAQQFAQQSASTTSTQSTQQK